MFATPDPLLSGLCATLGGRGKCACQVVIGGGGVEGMVRVVVVNMPGWSIRAWGGV